MAGNVKLVNLDRFRDCCLFSISINRFGNRAKVKNMTALKEFLQLLDQGGNETGEKAILLATDQVKSTKVLLRSETYDALCLALQNVKKFCIARAMPSFFRSGMFVVKASEVETMEKFVKAELAKIMGPDGALEKFIAAYPADVEKRKNTPVKDGGLGPLFDERDYPTPEEMRELFGLEWFWLTLSVPENIPEALREEANAKFARRMEDAAEEITACLRVEFQEMLQEVESRLTVKPGEKPKVFRNAMLENLADFLNTFSSKNVFGDEQLTALVNKAKALMLNDDGTLKMNPNKVRELANIKEAARAGFASINKEVAELIETTPTRKFGQLQD